MDIHKLRENFSVSDGFPWRTDNNFKTNFKYTDLLKVFYDEINSNVEIHFYDKNNNLIKTSSDLSMYLLNDTGVVTVAGDSFGAPEYIRLSYATSDEIIDKALGLIKTSLSK